MYRTWDTRASRCGKRDTKMQVWPCEPSSERLIDGFKVMVRVLLSPIHNDTATMEHFHVLRMDVCKRKQFWRMKAYRDAPGVATSAKRLLSCNSHATAMQQA
uniref:Uncharacterized protein n=1 Tax=Chlamydomonas euryale TaxID=1486919 RepID=A0A7R9Z5X1_9CHLO